MYELTVQYPRDGIHFAELAHSMILKVKPYDNANFQLFRIYKITSPMNGICTIYAEHVSYQLNHIPLMPFTAYSAMQAFAGISQNVAETCPFTFWTNILNAGTYTQEVPEMVRARLGGQAGSMLDVYGGEYEWDNYVVRLYQQRGTDRDVTLKYGKNITDISQEESIANTYTGITPFWRGQGVDDNAKAAIQDEITALTASIESLTDEITAQTAVVATAKARWETAKHDYGENSTQAKKKKKAYQNQKAILADLKKAKADAETEKANKQQELTNADGTLIDKLVITNPPTLEIDEADNFPYKRIRVVDFSDKFESEPTPAELKAYAQTWMEQNCIGEPVISIKVSFVALWNTEEYKNIAPLERVQLCDTVVVEFEKLGIRVAAKVTKYKYDVIMERYDSIQLGEAKSNFAETVSNTNGLIAEALKQVPTRTAMQDAIDIGTKIINGGYGGYLRYNTDADGQPTEMLIMDQPTLAEAHQVIRMNKNGIGYSTDGGLTYSSAWVFLGSGTQASPYRQMFYADIIRAGILGDQAGLNFWNMETGAFQLQSTATIKEGSTEKTVKNYVDGEAGTVADTKVTAYDTSLNQLAVFNKITNNQANQGIYLQNGNLYINASMIAAGILNGIKITQGATSQHTHIEMDDGEFKVYYSGIAGTIKGILHAVYPPVTPTPSGQAGFLINSDHYLVLTASDGLFIGADSESSTPTAPIYIGGANQKVYSQGIRAHTHSGAANVRVGTSSTGEYYGQLMQSTGSSRRWKHDIKPLDDEEIEAHKILDVEVVQFKYNSDYLAEDDQRSDKNIPGFIAEQVAEVYPIAAEINDDGTVDDWNVRYIVPPMLALIQEQQKRIESLESKITELETKLGQILTKIGE